MLWAIVALGVCVSGGGCTSRLVKEGFYGVTGGSGHYVLLTGEKDSLAQIRLQYGAVQVGGIENTIGAACPAEFLQDLPEAIQSELQPDEPGDTKDKDKEPLLQGPAGKVLSISGSVIHYDEGKFLDKIMGPLEEAVCRLQIRDAATGQVLAEANFVGRAKSSVRRGPKELAEGVARGIKKLLKPS